MKAWLRRRIDRHPTAKRILKWGLARATGGRSVSTGYAEIEKSAQTAEASRLRDSWQNRDLPERQYAIVEKELSDFRRGQDVRVFDVFVSALHDARSAGAERISLLEVGCSSGYYSEVIGIAGLDVDYSGCDYSSAFIEMARDRYPERNFKVSDACKLDYDDGAFDVVVSGCCLLHIPEYEAAVNEAARVARQYVIFHRTPLLLSAETTFFRKLAYEVETVEIHFNQEHFRALLREARLDIIAEYSISESPENGGSAIITIVCRKLQ